MSAIETRISDSLIRIATKAPPVRGAETPATLTIDVAALEHELRGGVTGEVRFEASDRAMYASDAGNYRMVPIGVVLPRNANDVLHTLNVCRRHGAPIVSSRWWNGNTWTDGECCRCPRFLEVHESH